MNQDQTDYIPVRDGQVELNNVLKENIDSQNIIKPSKIEQALSRFRNGVEKVYTESRERSLGRLKSSEDEMQRKFSITTVINNDTSELSRIGSENITRFLNDENQEVFEQAQKLDCYVIREQISSSKNREEEEERIYREQIERLQRKNQELEQQIIQKKRMQRQQTKLSNVTSTIKTSIERAPVVKTNFENVQMNITPAPLPLPSIQLKTQQFDFTSDLPIVLNQQVEVEQEQPEVSVVFEGKQKDLTKCLKKFAKKVFYLQRQVSELTNEKDKWKSEFEIADKNYKEIKIKYDEQKEFYNIQDKKFAELKIELEKYKVQAVSFEEEVNKLKHFQATETEVQIIEKIIEKPIEIIKHVILEKIVEKPIEIIKTIEAPPIEIEKIIEKIIEVPVEKVVEKVITVPHEIVIEKVVEVPKIEIVEREKIVEIPRPEYIEKIIHVEKPVYIERPQVIKEYIETKDLSAEKELHDVRENYRKLQYIQEESLRELEDWKIRCLRIEDQFKSNDANRSVLFERDRSMLVEEIKNSHQTIDDLRDRIEMLYKEITLLTDQNNRKNLDMTNQIRYLEDQLAAYAPKVISTTQYSGLPAYQPPIDTQHIQQTVYYKTSAPTVQYTSPPIVSQMYSQQPYQGQQYQQQQSTAITQNQQHTQQQQQTQYNQQYQQTFQPNNLNESQGLNSQSQRYQL